MKTVLPDIVKKTASSAKSGSQESQTQPFDLKLARDPILRTSLSENAEPVEILGVKVSRYTVPQAIGAVDRLIKTGGTHSVYFVNSRKLNIAYEDSEYLDVLKSADLVLSDSLGLAIAATLDSKRFTSSFMAKDFAAELCQCAAEGGYRVFLLGGNPGLADEAAKTLKKRMPELQICGVHHGCFDMDKCEDVLDHIRSAQPDILFVAFQSPLQEKWIRMHNDQLPQCVVIGAGGLFEHLAEAKSRFSSSMHALRRKRTLRSPMTILGKIRLYLVGYPLFVYRVYKERVAQLTKPLAKLLANSPAGRTIAPPESLAVRDGRRTRLLDIEVDRVGVQDTLQHIRKFVESRKPHYVVTANVDFAMLAHKSSIFQNIINEADLCVPDGVPLLWAAKFLGAPLVERVNGTNLIYSLCEDQNPRPYRFFLLGAKPESNIRAAEVLAKTYPEIEIAGRYSPPFGQFSEEENAKIINMVREAQPDILLVAFGPPKQEKWIHEHLAKCNVPVAIGIGGALDLIAGEYRRAPVWMQNHGLEWFFRLCVDFRRLWRRYLLRDMRFIPSVMIQKIGVIVRLIRSLSEK